MAGRMALRNKSAHGRFPEVFATDPDEAGVEDVPLAERSTVSTPETRRVTRPAASSEKLEVHRCEMIGYAGLSSLLLHDKDATAVNVTRHARRPLISVTVIDINGPRMASG